MNVSGNACHCSIVPVFLCQTASGISLIVLLKLWHKIFKIQIMKCVPAVVFVGCIIVVEIGIVSHEDTYLCILKPFKILE